MKRINGAVKLIVIPACIVSLALLAYGCGQADIPITPPSAIYQRPQDDFYEAINAEWLSTAEIPAGKMSVGGFDDLADEIENLLMGDFTAMLQKTTWKHISLEEFLKFYGMTRDYDQRNIEGIAPLQPYLNRIAAMENLSDFNMALPELILTGMSLPQVAAPISLSVQADWMDTTHYALYMDMPALILPDVSYYNTPTGDQLLSTYQNTLQDLIIMSGYTQDEATRMANQAIAFDRLLTAYTKTALEQADISGFYNPWPTEKLYACSNSIDFKRLLSEMMSNTPTKVIITNETFFLALDEIINDETFPLLKDWLYGRFLFCSAPALSEEMIEAVGAYNLLLTGKTSLEDHNTLAYRLAAEPYKEIIGVYYGRTYFGAEARDYVTDMAENIRSVYIRRMENNDWLSEDTKTAAIEKLSSMKVHIGYPEKTNPISDQLLINENNVLDQYISLMRKHVTYNLSLAGNSVDPDEWIMSGHTVNAINHLMSNTIYFPAAILQEPFYSPKYSESRNYGSIGAVIAHEITHAFDTNGAKFDQYGTMSNWWTEADYTAFQERANAMVALFDGLPFAGGHVNGNLTATENISDAGGLSCALEIVEELPNADIREFFEGWATIWRIKTTPELEQILLQLDTHAPYKLRTNIQVQLLDAFYKAYGVQEGDKMYLAPNQRISVW